MSKTLSRLLLPIFIFSSALHTAASELTLKNGDRLSGKIVEELEGSIVLETEYAGKITIAKAFIEKIGDGETALADKGKIRQGPSGTRLEELQGAAAKPKAGVSSLVARKRLFGGRYMGIAEGWEGNANIGFSFSSGNSNNTTMTTGLRAVKTGGKDNLTVYARSLWNSSRKNGNMVTTQNAFWGGARYDRNIGDKQFAFVSYDFERDRPNNLDFRSVAGGGIGRHLVKSGRTELDVLSGGAWNRTWQVGPNTDSPEILVGSTFKHRFDEKLRLQETFTYFQNATDRAEFRVLFDATVSADITKKVGLFVTFGNRFNNDPIGNARKNDFLFTTGMKWNFGRKK